MIAAIALVVLAPQGGLSVIDPAQLRSALALRLNREAEVRVDQLDAELAASCVQEISCLIERSVGAPHLLLVLSAVRGKNEDRLAATLIDVERARAEMNRPDREDRESIEAAINESSVLLRPEWTDIENASRLERHLDTLVKQHLEPALRKVGAWQPKIERAAAELAPAVPSAVDHTYEQMRTGLMWGGAITAAAGAGVFTYALLSGGDRRVVCLSGDAASSSCEETRVFPRSGLGSEPAPSFAGGYNRSGVALAPLGYSLFAAGATWLLGAYLDLAGDDRVPWIELVVGLGAGVLIYGVSIAAEGETP